MTLCVDRSHRAPALALSGVLAFLAACGGEDPPPKEVPSPTQVRDVTNAAEQAEPGLMDRIGSFYAEHPELVKTLGAGALMIALARFKNSR